MPKPCNDHLYPDDPHTTYRAGCHICKLAATRTDYALLWGEPAPGKTTAARSKITGPVEPPPCPHLGDPTGDTVECASCSGLISMPVHACGKYGLTVIGTRRPKSDEIRACRWCPDRPR